MEYNSLDTSLIIRTITNDIPKKRDLVTLLLLHPRKILVVADYAVIEVVYVLSKTYNMPRKVLVDKLKYFLRLDNIRYNHEVMDEALELYLGHPKLSFNDCCLAVQARLDEAVPLWTFDRKLANQLPGAKMLDVAIQ